MSGISQIYLGKFSRPTMPPTNPIKPPPYRTPIGITVKPTKNWTGEDVGSVFRIREKLTQASVLTPGFTVFQNTISSRR